MNSIASEPGRLQAEQHRIRRELASIAVEHHSVLVQASDRASKVLAISASASEIAQKCETSLNNLKISSANLQESGATWRRDREVAAIAGTMASKVTELIDASSTLESCIRSEMYHEARLLIEHVSSIAEAFRGVRLMQQIAADVYSTFTNLISLVVIPRLGGNLNVAAALKIIGFLRNLNADEGTLRDSFLQLRTDYINAFVAEEQSIDSGMPGTLLKRVLVHWKVVISDVIATFNGGFSMTDDNADALQEWSYLRTSQLLKMFDTLLPGVSSGVDLADLSLELSYCAPPWCTLGIDVSVPLLGLICTRVAEIFESHLQAGREAFLMSMSTASWKHTPSLAKLAPYTSAQQSDIPSPPPRIVQCLPLTYVVHGVVNACNDVRRCAALAAWPRCKRAIEALIRIIVEEVKSVKEDMQKGEDTEAAAALTAICAQDCIPFICRCVEFTFDVNTFSDAITSAALQELTGCNDSSEAVLSRKSVPESL